MTADLIMPIVQTAIGTSAAILLVLALRNSIRKLFGSNTVYALWLIVPIVMVACLLPAQVITVSTEGPGTAQSAALAQETPVRIDNSRSIATVMSNDTALTPVATSVSKANLVDTAKSWAPNIWLLGFLFAGTFLVFQQWNFNRQHELKKLSKRVHIAENDDIGPAAVGVLNPRILLPRNFKQLYSKRERSMIFAHEKSHITAGDLQINLLAALIRCLNWYNPLVFAAFKAFRVDQELACDERVMRRFGTDRRLYAETLLKSQMINQVAPIGCTWLPENMHPLKQRIAALSVLPQTRTKRILGSLVLLASFGLSGAAAWAALATNTVYVNNDPAAEASYSSNDEHDDTPTSIKGSHLVNALLENRDASAMALIKAGADVNYRQFGEGTPLIIAAMRRNHDMVEALIEAGADVNKASRGDGTPLIAAADQNDLEITQLLLKNGANPNGYSPTDGSPLVIAAEENNMEIAKLLIDAGADANQAVPSDGSPLIAAARRGHLAMVKMLVSQGADVNGFVLYDETPLIGAAAENRVDVASFLIEKGADVNLTVETGARQSRPQYRSPLGQAELYGHRAMIALLKQHGAKRTTGKED